MQQLTNSAARRPPPCTAVFASLLQAREVIDFEPEGIHLTLWTSDTMLVSWQTGGESTPPSTDLRCPGTQTTSPAAASPLVSLCGRTVLPTPTQAPSNP